MKNFVILGIYMAAMGTGLVFCSQVLGTAYDSPEFGGKFLPFTIFLAVLVLCYGIKNQEDVALHTKNKKRYFPFLLLFVPVAGLAVYSAAESFRPEASFFLAFLDSLLVGIGEEGMYRGILLGGFLRKMRPIVAIPLSSAFFSLLHLLNLLGGISPSDVMNQMLSTFLMGLFLGSVYLDTKNIGAPVLFHFLWDYIMLSGGLAGSEKIIGVLVAASILEAFISAVLLIQFRKMPRPVPCHGGEG